ncbi:unnamed protein product [Rhizoctonia solani]|uniref:Uncharacterized protein n=1 Tax=Rhizoctonia solani TaxID=456999 RepID=A0A8H3AHN4_9AGAM|nr:unnamed protein product [Rhizoctonia solani]
MSEGITAETSDNPRIGEEHGAANDGAVNKEDRHSSVIGHGPAQALNIYFTQEFLRVAEPLEVWTRALSGQPIPIVRFVGQEEQAQVVLTVNANNSTTFIFRNQDLVTYGAQMFFDSYDHPITPHLPQVMPILTLLSRWHQYLGLRPDSRPFEKAIDLEFYKLRATEEHNEEGYPVLVPEGPNLNVGGVVDFVASTDDYYGVQVVNRSTQDLYAYFFDFSTASLAIHRKAIPILGSSPSDPTLLKNAPLTIGYGGGSQFPFIFEVSEMQNIDANMFKLFVCTHPIDFGSFEQESPFVRCVIPDKVTMPVFEEGAQWDAFTMTIVQRLHPKEAASASTQIPKDPLP